MPYANTADLPNGVRDNLPQDAQEIYLAAYNNAWEEYREPANRRGTESREEVARKVAWAAVKKIYEKNASGDWVKK